MRYSRTFQKVGEHLSKLICLRNSLRSSRIQRCAVWGRPPRIRCSPLCDISVMNTWSISSTTNAGRECAETLSERLVNPPVRLELKLGDMSPISLVVSMKKPILPFVRLIHSPRFAPGSVTINVRIGVGWGKQALVPWRFAP